MPVSPVDPVAAVKLTYDAFKKLVGYFGKRKDEKDLKRRIDAAWRELVKGDAADEVVIKAALAAAKAAGDTSDDHVRLDQTYRHSRKKTPKKPKKKATRERKRKSAPRRKRKR